MKIDARAPRGGSVKRMPSHYRCPFCHGPMPGIDRSEARDHESRCGLKRSKHPARSSGPEVVAKRGGHPDLEQLDKWSSWALKGQGGWGPQ